MPNPAADLTQKNADYYDKEATTYALDPSKLHLARLISTTILTSPSIPSPTFTESSTRILDFACGVGLLSQCLTPHAKEIVGVDTSARSIEVYNRRVWEQGLEASDMRGVCADLLSLGDEGEKPEQGVGKGSFDVVVCSMSYHHFHSISHATQVLTSYLKPSGYLIVADIARTPDTVRAFQRNEDIKEVVSHVGGLEVEEVRRVMREAGLGGVVVEERLRFKIRVRGAGCKQTHGHSHGHESGDGHSHGSGAGGHSHGDGHGHGHGHAHGHSHGKGGNHNGPHDGHGHKLEHKHEEKEKEAEAEEGRDEHPDVPGDKGGHPMSIFIAIGQKQ
ncbi:S-adenosyl-L-methionine-dependent methyltransferase [Saitoella complicata NRRL Y-17804]|uniref:Methyltransferase domain-containing protein n=1 Tax=Saitoella complicata (strain BCRC 22490 / CBS 7301 / JCM 7358 / NBRC 10748 / NRRL Y-17804) TaxID=698492 RepID=A0A0E9NDQ7_SAICN|nr:S-adenosyl-L-methionine-dependent methyltransferase [Saitoella complicata NRRL Y-17804]ODQ50678.1 S-adenosyl-L-methionine-dependent methyltransferase [Saitoella complicata NRRL Y-17804]GAO47933.1 hypothetical protein G7K_2128-t1 [Saitoella complicata NRRL Y-17804]